MRWWWGRREEAGTIMISLIKLLGRRSRWRLRWEQQSWSNKYKPH
jgi:hypothetical protein